ncbi:MAG: hypothetical protein GTN76_04825 [Candidatus Aenigmarchaeota archaeon]|nr:hypothetical protein [Candidatus Aenigmarchaeota archaeon]
MAFLVPKFDPNFRNWKQQWVWKSALEERYRQKGFSRQSLSYFLRPGMKYSKEHFIYLFYAPPKNRISRGLLTGERDRRSRREIEIDICSRALTAAMEGEQAPLKFFTEFFLSLPPAWYIHVAEQLYLKRKWWEAPNDESPLSYVHKIVRQRKAAADKEEAEVGIFNELISPIEPYGTDPPEYLSEPPTEIPLDPHRISKIVENITGRKFSDELLELLTVFINYNCESYHEAAQIMGWNEQQYQRVKKEFHRKRSILIPKLKK